MSDEDETETLVDWRYWKDLCPKGYYLIGFSYRHSAQFGVEGERGSFEVSQRHIDFFSRTLAEQIFTTTHGE